MPYDTLAVEHDGPVTRVWLDRPQKLNALNPAALEEIVAVFDGLQRRFETQVVVLGGRGRAFCAGADRTDPPARLARGSGAGPRERRWTSQLGRRALEAIERCEAITIARLHGHVVGGGVVLAMACDFRVAATSALLHVPEVDLGIPLTWGAVPRLIRELGMARAKEVVLLCDRIDAARAERLGLVNVVVADGALDPTVDDWARRLAGKPSWAVHMTKTQFQAYGRTVPLGDVTASDGDLLAAATSEDPTRFAMPPKA
jgi:enoyl-CoA hydratase/carnithine racemase